MKERLSSLPVQENGGGVPQAFSLAVGIGRLGPHPAAVRGRWRLPHSPEPEAEGGLPPSGNELGRQANTLNHLFGIARHACVAMKKEYEGRRHSGWRKSPSSTGFRVSNGVVLQVVLAHRAGSLCSLKYSFA